MATIKAKITGLQGFQRGTRIPDGKGGNAQLDKDFTRVTLQGDKVQGNLVVESSEAGKLTLGQTVEVTIK